MNGRSDYVDSWATLSGGRMLGHRVAFQPSRATGDYGGFYGAADTGRYFKITSDGTVFFKGGAVNLYAYLIAFDGPSRTKIIAGDPGGYVNWTSSPSMRDVSDEARKQELDAAVVDSRGTYAAAELRAREILAAGDAALLAAAPGVVAPKYDVQSGSELINLYAEKDAAAKALAEAAAKKKSKKKPKKKPSPKPRIPAWAWAVGGGALLLLVGGAFLARRKQIGA